MDEQLVIRMVVKDEKVLIGFNVPVTWIAFDAQQATNFAHDLLNNAECIKDKKNAH